MSEDMDKSRIEELKELMGSDILHLVEKFIQNSEKYIDGIAQGFTEEDAECIKNNAHPLKSSSGMMGLMRGSELAADLEEMAKSGIDDFSGSGKAFALFVELRAAVEAGLSHLKTDMDAV